MNYQALSLLLFLQLNPPTNLLHCQLAVQLRNLPLSLLQHQLLNRVAYPVHSHQRYRRISQPVILACNHQVAQVRSLQVLRVRNHPHCRPHNLRVLLVYRRVDNHPHVQRRNPLLIQALNQARNRLTDLLFNHPVLLLHHLHVHLLLSHPLHLVLNQVLCQARNLHVILLLSHLLHLVLNQVLCQVLNLQDIQAVNPVQHRRRSLQELHRCSHRVFLPHNHQAFLQHYPRCSQALFLRLLPAVVPLHNPVSDQVASRVLNHLFSLLRSRLCLLLRRLRASRLAHRRHFLPHSPRLCQLCSQVQDRQLNRRVVRRHSLVRCQQLYLVRSQHANRLCLRRVYRPLSLPLNRH